MSQSPPTETDLVQQFAPLIRRTAVKIARELRMRVSVEDLIQAGTIGLIEAHRRFDPGVGAPFEAWAYFRIKGSFKNTYTGTFSFLPSVQAAEQMCQRS